MQERSYEDMQPVLEALQRWAIGHPKKDLPFLVVQGQAFTPMTFYETVREQSEFAEPFLNYLFREAQEQGVAPKTLIDQETRKQR